jgi:hypothetical protein
MERIKFSSNWDAKRTFITIHVDDDKSFEAVEESLDMIAGLVEEPLCLILRRSFKSIDYEYFYRLIATIEKVRGIDAGDDKLGTTEVLNLILMSNKSIKEACEIVGVYKNGMYTRKKQ